MKITTRIKRYGNTAIISLNKEIIERLDLEDNISIGEFVEIEIKKIKQLNTSQKKIQ